MPHTAPHYHYQRFASWRLISPFWNPRDYKSNFHGSVYQYNCSEKENLSQETAIDLEYFNIPRKLRLDVAKTFKFLRFNQSVINSANKIKKVIGPGPWAGVAIRSWSDYRRRQDLFDLKSVENQLNRLHPKYSFSLQAICLVLKIILYLV